MSRRAGDAVLPVELTPLEQFADDLLLFENFERYSAQSAATQVNARAPLPPRAPALPFTTGSLSA